MTDINPAGKATAEALNEDGVEASFIQTDMGMTDAAIAMVDEAAARMGTVTALVNAAGNTERGSILDTTPDHWDRIHDANSKGPFFALQRFAQLAIENKHAASAVNILSIVVHGGLPFLAPYGAEEVATLAAFLLGPQSGVMTGSIIDFDQQVVGAYPDTNDN